MTDTERFIEYAIAFEQVLLTDDWQSLEQFFTEDAVHQVKGGGPLAAHRIGRGAVVGGLRHGVDAVDRRFDRRLPEITSGPDQRDGAVWMTWRLTLERDGLPALIIEGNHATRYRDGRICRLDEEVSDGVGARVAAYLAEHADRLLPSRLGAQSGPDVERMRALVVGYAEAKSRADVDGALALCHDCFELETVSFGVASRDKAETFAHLHAFFGAFPDYHVSVDRLVFGDGIAACWGSATMTMRGDFGGIPASGAGADIPIFCVFTFADGLLASERFFFDLAMLCEGIRVPIAEIQSTLAAFRSATAVAA